MYGEVKDVKVINKAGNCFAFIEFCEVRDAQDSLKEYVNQKRTGLPSLPSSLLVAHALSACACLRVYTFRNNRELHGKPIRLEAGNNGKKRRNEGCYSCGSLTHFAKDCTVGGGRSNYRELSSFSLCQSLIALALILHQAVVVHRTRVAVAAVAALLTDNDLALTIDTQAAEDLDLPSMEVAAAVINEVVKAAAAEATPVVAMTTTVEVTTISSRAEAAATTAEEVTTTEEDLIITEDTTMEETIDVALPQLEVKGDTTPTEVVLMMLLVTEREPPTVLVTVNHMAQATTLVVTTEDLNKEEILLPIPPEHQLPTTRLP